MTTSSAASRRAVRIERFTAPGQPFEMGERTVRGVPMRVYTTGPLTLSDIALASTGPRTGRSSSARTSGGATPSRPVGFQYLVVVSDL